MRSYTCSLACMHIATYAHTHAHTHTHTLAHLLCQQENWCLCLSVAVTLHGSKMLGMMQLPTMPSYFPPPNTYHDVLSDISLADKRDGVSTNSHVSSLSCSIRVGCQVHPNYVLPLGLWWIKTCMYVEGLCILFCLYITNDCLVFMLVYKL